jgi:hypothetical protein
MTLYSRLGTPVSLETFSVLSETVFAHIVAILNENEKERRTLGCFGFAWYIFSGPKRNDFRSHFPASNEN